ncbi:hypothetical protein Patl1_25318 [Pistacia atlantica]|uniref:Uncharacterized protein n=1 Tax=Pistacia atlantica TaxID=434234 RepID=A0ACC1B2I0_9ROSI|nr:hypothetical protein Patl1_25318 [Pistacia atlantica]
MQECVSSTIELFSHLAKDSPLAYYSDLNEQSKVEKLPGGGKVADILLVFPFWKNFYLVCSQPSIVGLNCSFWMWVFTIKHEGISSTVESFSHLAKDSPLAHYIDLNEQSKVEQLLGSGKVFTWLCWVANLVTQFQHDRNIKTIPVADIFLWRDEKKSFTYFLTLVVLFYWFFLSGRTFTSSAANLLLLVSIALFGYGFLSSNIFALKVPSIPLSSFQISETLIKNSIARIAFLWNWGIWNLRTLDKGDDVNNFIMVYFGTDSSALHVTLKLSILDFHHVVMLHLFCSTLNFCFVKIWAYTILKSIQVILALYLLMLILLQSSLTIVIAVGKEFLV